MDPLVFGNPSGLWALLALPVVLAIHFLQPRSRRVWSTTLFLLDHLPPLATTGRTWRWLRQTWALWLQLLAVVLLTWLLAEPRWQRRDSVQTIAVLLDATASLRAFRDDAVAALRRQTAVWEKSAARTEWIVRETELARPVLYRGFDRAAALAALDRWHPDLGAHDFGPALAVARQLVRRQGAAVLVTDRRPDVPRAGVALLAVGHPLENAGFAGGTVQPAEAPGEPARWTVLLQHRGTAPVRRTLTIRVPAPDAAAPDASEGPGTAAPVRAQDVTLAAGELLTLSGEFPAGVDTLLFALTPDAFDLDDTLPLVIPVPRPLSWRVQAPEKAGEFFRRFLDRTPGLTPAASGSRPDLMVFSTRTLFNHPLAGAALAEIVVYAEDAPADRVARAPIVAEKHPWLEGLSWSGLLGPGPQAQFLPEGAQALLWQGDRPLAWLESLQGVPRLTLGWDWSASNAARLPASAVLLHRLVADARRRKPAPETLNLDTGQALVLPEPAAEAASGPAVWTLRRAGGAPQTLTPAERTAARAPLAPGLFSVYRDDTLMLRAAAQFADAREADFAGAETLAAPEDLPLDVLEASSERDHLRPLWLLLLLGVLLAAWAAQAPRPSVPSGVPTIS